MKVSKIGLKAFAIGTVLCFGGLGAGAATVDTFDGSTLDLTKYTFVNGGSAISQNGALRIRGLNGYGQYVTNAKIGVGQSVQVDVRVDQVDTLFTTSNLKGYLGLQASLGTLNTSGRQQFGGVRPNAGFKYFNLTNGTGTSSNSFQVSQGLGTTYKLKLDWLASDQITFSVYDGSGVLLAVQNSGTVSGLPSTMHVVLGAQYGDSSFDNLTISSSATAIPLPSAAVAGMVILGLSGVVRRSRRD